MEKDPPLLSKKDFSNICRLCLRQGPVESIFDLKHEESSFSDILLELFSTQVKLEDELPKNVCETCISEITHFYNFRKVVIGAEKILQAIITKESNRTIHRPITYDKDIKLEDFDNSTISKKDVREDLIEIKLDPTFNETYDSNVVKLKVEGTGIKLDDSSHEDEIQNDCISRMDNIDTTEGFSSDRKDTKKLIDDFISDTGNIDFKVRRLGNGVKKKTKSLQPKIFTCSCQKTFTLKSEYVKHRKEAKHPRPRNHTCKICTKNFNKTSLKLHMRTHTKEKPYECKTCSERFGRSGSLKRHMMLHTGEKPYVCEFCGKGFIQGPELTAQKRIHTGEKPFLCTFCMKGFTTKGLLDKHILRHGEKEFLCSCCGKKFHTNEGLQTHLRVHTGAKPYSCTFCHKHFRQKPALRAHVLTHTRDKPYECTVCLRAFTLKQHLKTHLKTHSGEKPYACPHCNKSFSQNGNLRVHIRTHTGETPHMCGLCPRGFYDSSSLKRHRKRHLVDSKVEKKGD